MNWKLIRIIDTCVGIPLLLWKALLKNTRKKSLKQQNDTTPNRILLIKFWGIGNIAMILPSISVLRSTWPDASIDFLTLESNRNALDTFGAVNDVITVDTGSTSRFVSSALKAVGFLSEKNYDIIIDFEQFARFSALVSHRIGGKKIIGFRTLGQHRHHLFTHTVEYVDDMHVTRSFFSLAVTAGVTSPFPEGFTLPGMEALKKQGRSLLVDAGISTDKPLVVMHIGTSDNFRERRWLPANYAYVADHLAERLGAKIILTGLADESFLISETISYLNKPASAIDFSGRLGFKDYASLIAVADLVFSADTAAVHLASILDIPVIGIYGPNTPQLYGPWGKRGLALYDSFECSPCITNFNAKTHTCRHPDGQGACMRAISSRSACNAIDSFLSSGILSQARQDVP